MRSSTKAAVLVLALVAFALLSQELRSTGAATRGSTCDDGLDNDRDGYADRQDVEQIICDSDPTRGSNLGGNFRENGNCRAALAACLRGCGADAGCATACNAAYRECINAGATR